MTEHDATVSGRKLLMRRDVGGVWCMTGTCWSASLIGAGSLQTLVYDKCSCISFRNLFCRAMILRYIHVQTKLSTMEHTNLLGV